MVRTHSGTALRKRRYELLPPRRDVRNKSATPNAALRAEKLHRTDGEVIVETRTLGDTLQSAGDLDGFSALSYILVNIAYYD